MDWLNDLKVRIESHVISEYKNILTLAIVMDDKLTDILAIDLEKI